MKNEQDVNVQRLGRDQHTKNIFERRSKFYEVKRYIKQKSEMNILQKKTSGEREGLKRK